MKSENNLSPKIWAIIPAAGVGLRMQISSKKPKQYYRIGEQSVLEHTLNPFLSYPFEKIIVVIQKTDIYWEKLPLSSIPQICTTEGGQTRVESVWRGLSILKSFNVHSDDWILIHDAVRPCLTLEKLTMFIDKLKGEDVGGLMAVPVRDTLKYAIDNKVSRTVARQNIWQAQTPQMFRYAHLYNALKRAMLQNVNVSDEASAIEKIGYQPRIIFGDATNVKITYDQDIDLAKCLLRRT